MLISYCITIMITDRKESNDVIRNMWFSTIHIIQVYYGASALSTLDRRDALKFKVLKIQIKSSRYYYYQQKTREVTFYRIEFGALLGNLFTQPLTNLLLIFNFISKMYLIREKKIEVGKKYFKINILKISCHIVENLINEMKLYIFHPQPDMHLIEGCY